MRREARGEDLLGLRADDALDRLSVLVDEERGDALYAERGGGLRVLVNVELGDAVATARLRRKLFERGRDHTARAAPRGPTVEQHGPRGRRLDDLARESRVRHRERPRRLRRRIRRTAAARSVRAGRDAFAVEPRAAPAAHRLPADHSHALVHAVLRAALRTRPDSHRLDLPDLKLRPPRFLKLRRPGFLLRASVTQLPARVKVRRARSHARRVPL